MDLSCHDYHQATQPAMSHLNIGSGHEISIADLAAMIAGITGYRGRLVFDATKPDGTPRKLLDTSALHALGWTAKVPLEQGLKETYHSYCRAQAEGDRHASARGLDALSRQIRLNFPGHSARYHAYQDMQAPT
jgi:GDP-L-fucose synthase